ncbi:60S ribosomal protein L5 [Bienertia sinuspersici]
MLMSCLAMNLKQSSATMLLHTSLVWSGLLLARRATGEDYSVEPADTTTTRPFLDVGLIRTRTTTGNRVFGALKLICINREPTLDGGLDIPHSDKRFALLDFQRIARALTLRFTVNTSMVGMFLVSSYMKTLMEGYQSYFSEFGINPDNLEELYNKVHATIRADSVPNPKKSDKPAPKQHKSQTLIKHYNRPFVLL